MKKLLLILLIVVLATAVKKPTKANLQTDKSSIDSFFDKLIDKFDDDTPSVPPPTTVQSVNISKYLGVWYEQARIPFFFEYFCTNSYANYSLNANGTLKIVNTCDRFGIKTSADGTATPQDPTNTKLGVTFAESFGIVAQYWIVRLDSNYSYVVISSPDYEYLWILYREPSMPLTLYQSIIASLKQSGGFRVDKLVRTSQEQ